MKTTAVIKAVCWSLLAVILTGILVSVIAVRTAFRAWDWSWNNLWSYVDKSYDDDATALGGEHAGNPIEVNAAEVNSITIDWSAGDIIVKRSDGDQIRFVETGNRPLKEDNSLRYFVEDGELEIDFTKHDNYMFKNLSKALTVEVPKDLYELEIETVSSNIELTDLNCESIEIYKVSGSLRTENVTSGHIDYGTVSGSVELQGGFRSVNGESVSGSTKIRSFICPGEIDIESVSGSIKIQIPENDGFAVNKSSASGSLNSDFEGTIRKDGMVYKNGGAQFNFDTVSGSVTVNRLTDESAE